jgi:hypothetical protein
MLAAMDSANSSNLVHKQASLFKLWLHFKVKAASASKFKLG